MRYIIWGTGSAAKRVLLSYYSFFENNPIIAFFDNNLVKKGKVYI